MQESFICGAEEANHSLGGDEPMPLPFHFYSEGSDLLVDFQVSADPSKEPDSELQITRQSRLHLPVHEKRGCFQRPIADA
jgi:hypothetical protein